MANETLLFRKGLQANLADVSKCPIKPGAISITIDEPGMYVDLPANPALGHANAYRVRIGDVITVSTLKQLSELNLQNLTPDDLSDDGTNPLSKKINSYSSSALYYVSDQNMLLKYNATTEKFIWINDTSSLAENISALQSTVSQIDTRLGNLETEVGDPKSGNNNATGLYKYIDDADKALQDQIDDIKGGSGGTSLSGLKDALDAEIEARKQGDQDLNSTLTGVNTRLSTAESNLSNLTTTVANNKTAIEQALANEKTAREQADTALGNRIKDYEDNKSKFALAENLTSVSNKLNQLDTEVGNPANPAGGGNATGIYKLLDDEKAAREQADTNLGSRIKALEDLDIDDTYATKGELSALEKGKVQTNAENIQSLQNNLSQNYYTTGQVYNKTEIDQKVNGLNTSIGTAQSNAEAKAAELVAAEAKSREDKDKELAEAISNISTNIGSNYATKTELNTAVTNLEKYADQAEADAITEAVSQANAHTNSEISKLSQTVNQNKTDLQGNIDDINTNLTNNYYTKSQLYTKGEIDNIKTNLEKYADQAEADALSEATKLVNAEKTARENADKGLQESISGISTNLSSNYYTKTEIDGKETALNSAITKAKNDAIAAAKTETTTQVQAEAAARATAISNAKTELSGAITEVSNRVTAIDNEIGDKKTSTTAATGMYKYIDDGDAATLEAAKAFALEKLQAAEAMVYMGTVTGANDAAIQNALAAKTNVEAGHVWVVGSLTETYRPGDLFVADKDGSGTGNKLAWSTDNWIHIKTGYDATLEQWFEHTTNSNKVQLKSISNIQNGSISFAADSNSSTKVTVTSSNAGKDATVTIGMMWEDF